MYGTSQPKIGELLVSSGLITPEQRDHLLEVQKEKGGKFGELAIAEEMITEDDLLNILSSQLNIPVVNLEEAIIDPKVPLLLPSKIAQRYSMLPIEETENKIVIAVADPTNIQGIDDAKMMLNKDVELVLCRKADLLRNIDDYYGGVESVQELLEGITEDDIELVKDEADLTGNGAVDIEDNRIVKYVNLIILEAIKNHASDVHLEPFENEFVIRQRIDGVLHKMPAPPKQVQNAVISRIKVMADLNIAESRLPQDGRIKLRLAGKEIDLRVSSLPTVFGESVVLRLLDRTAQILTLEQLGMSDETRIKMEKIIENPNGIVVVTGPTGCGKTSSLYACVVKLHNPEDKFITVEDPVEYEIDTLTQVQVHEKVGLTFGATLRSILRQDPDIILVGEIRDVETAEISIQASLTGHLVLTTLHTNEAAGSITRLIDMGIEPFLLTSTILAVCGQRLVRTICPMCKEVADIDKEKLKLLAPPNTDISKITLYRGRGCEECTGTGYKGRTGIFELFIMSEEIQELVLQKAPANVLHAKAQELGMVTMAMDGWNKVMQGITTLEEVHRVAPLKTS
ncbi:MAG: type II secretion system protein GspE [Candidatus Hydrogenedentes bacterium CG07_land_8_20_14_0_80_42_17]|nr:MAG: type II secretion system protein GspE [Candidatus Hydrogenedentes bacterium CG07_land_8_20_14_0_80_42_17]